MQERLPCPWAVGWKPRWVAWQAEPMQAWVRLRALDPEQALGPWDWAHARDLAWAHEVLQGVVPRGAWELGCWAKGSGLGRCAE